MIWRPFGSVGGFIFKQNVKNEKMQLDIPICLFNKYL